MGWGQGRREWEGDMRREKKKGERGAEKETAVLLGNTWIKFGVDMTPTSFWAFRGRVAALHNHE